MELERLNGDLTVPSSISTAPQRVQRSFFHSLCFSHAQSESLHVNQVQDCSTTPATSLLLRMVHSHWKQFPEFTSGQQENRGCVSGRRFSDEKVRKAKRLMFSGDAGCCVCSLQPPAAVSPAGCECFSLNVPQKERRRREQSHLTPKHFCICTAV